MTFSVNNERVQVKTGSLINLNDVVKTMTMAVVVGDLSEGTTFIYLAPPDDNLSAD